MKPADSVAQLTSEHVNLVPSQGLDWTKATKASVYGDLIDKLCSVPVGMILKLGPLDPRKIRAVRQSLYLWAVRRGIRVSCKVVGKIVYAKRRDSGEVK